MCVSRRRRLAILSECPLLASIRPACVGLACGMPSLVRFSTLGPRRKWHTERRDRSPRQARASFPSPPHFAVAQTSWPQPLSRRQCLPNSWIIKTQPKLALLLSTDPACGGHTGGHPTSESQVENEVCPGTCHRHVMSLRSWMLTGIRSVRVLVPTKQCALSVPSPPKVSMWTMVFSISRAYVLKQILS